MPSNSTLDSPPASQGWATAADRQEAARQTYQKSLATGRPLSGVQLGTMFGRSPRWGVDRIAEVRSSNTRRIGRTGHQPDDAAAPNGNGTRETAAATSNAALPTRSNGNGSNAHTDAGPHLNGRNGNGEADQVLPIRSAGNDGTLPNGRNGNSTHPHEPPEPRAHTEPQATAADAGGAGGPNAKRAQPDRRSRSLLDTAITLVVAAVAAAASYGHMLDVALMAGEPLWIARAFPITVDGLVLAALRRGEDGRGWLALGAAVSVAANVLAQFPELAAAAGPVVSAWPPLALYGTHRLLASRHGPRTNHAPAEDQRRWDR